MMIDIISIFGSIDIEYLSNKFNDLIYYDKRYNNDIDKNIPIILNTLQNTFKDISDEINKTSKTINQSSINNNNNNDISDKVLYKYIMLTYILT